MITVQKPFKRLCQCLQPAGELKPRILLGKTYGPIEKAAEMGIFCIEAFVRFRQILRNIQADASLAVQIMNINRQRPALKRRAVFLHIARGAVQAKAPLCLEGHRQHAVFFRKQKPFRQFYAGGIGFTRRFPFLQYAAPRRFVHFEIPSRCSSRARTYSNPHGEIIQ